MDSRAPSFRETWLRGDGNRGRLRSTVGPALELAVPTAADRESAALSGHAVQSRAFPKSNQRAEAKTLAAHTLAFVRQTLASIHRLGRQRDQTHDEGLQDPCLAVLESRDLLVLRRRRESNPRLKVLQTAASIREPRPTKSRKFERSCPPTYHSSHPDPCLASRMEPAGSVLGHIDLKDPQVDGVLAPQIAHVDHLVLGHRSLPPTHKGHWGDSSSHSTTYHTRGGGR